MTSSHDELLPPPGNGTDTIVASCDTSHEELLERSFHSIDSESNARLSDPISNVTTMVPLQAVSLDHKIHEAENVQKPAVAFVSEASTTSPERITSPPMPATQNPMDHIKNDHFVRRKMSKFHLHETQQRYYLVGTDSIDSQYRILKIDRTSPPTQLNIVEDEVVYTKREMNQLLKTIEHGNRATGGMKLKAICYGLLGFIRFTEAYYMVMITKRQQVAMVGGYFVHQIESTELVPLTSGSSSRYQSNRNADEARYLGIFNNLDLHHSFYFSYSYNITRSLQHNIIKGREEILKGHKPNDQYDINDMVVWNHHLLGPAIQSMKNPYDWCLPIIHGFIDQSSINCFGRNIYITLIARRSRFYAGARFLKRGVNDLGYVANDVETEQIVADMTTTSFDGPGHFALQNPNYTSFVQHRGSIPLHWTQDNSGVSPKPAIDLAITDPFYASAALHFDNMFERYGAPVCVLNLVKARERTPRESKLLVEYQNAVNYLNQSLPEGKKMLYRAYDMARAAKTPGQDVIGTLEKISADLLHSTGFFHNGSVEFGETSVQNGICRSNCVDCLDRTNAAQFVVGKTAFAAQLQALGVIAEDSVNYDSDASNLFAHMFNDHGDTLASQYGGSHLVNTTDSYRKINNWQSHSRDMLESFKRYYHNSFLDSQRQEAYNLFLGNYKYAQGEPMLWELPNDYYLHHAIPSSWSADRRRNYISWYTPDFLKTRELPPLPTRHDLEKLSATEVKSDWWRDYYRPQILSFQKSFAYKLNSTTRYLPKTDPLKYNMSPFCVRKQPYDIETQEKTRQGKEVTVTDADSREIITPLSATSAPKNPAKRIHSLQQWLQPPPTSPVQDNEMQQGEHESSRLRYRFENNHRAPESMSADAKFRPADKALRNQWTLQQFHSNSLHPTVTDKEANAYDSYLLYPLRMPLAVSDETQAADYANFKRYLEEPDTTNNLNGNYSTYGDVDISNPAVFSALASGMISAATLADLEQYLSVKDEPLTVTEEDNDKKRYQAYRKWLRGKSLFKQSKFDSEYAKTEPRTAQSRA